MGYEAILRNLELFPRHPITINTENFGNAVRLEHREPFTCTASKVDDTLGMDEIDQMRDYPSRGLEGHVPMVVVPCWVVRARVGHGQYLALTYSMPPLQQRQRSNSSVRTSASSPHCNTFLILSCSF
jgi:hypothetical protein